MKRTLRTILILAITAIICMSAVGCATIAAWQNKPSDYKTIDVETLKANGSEKYIIYAAIDADGNMIVSTDGTTEVASYAVVGYTGIVAELVIPAQYNGKNVTRVLACGTPSSYKCYQNGSAYTGVSANLQNNKVVTTIVFGANISRIGAGVCVGMTNVTKLTFAMTSGTVVIGEGAFAACSSLATVIKESGLTLSLGTNAFLATPYANA